MVMTEERSCAIYATLQHLSGNGVKVCDCPHHLALIFLCNKAVVGGHVAEQGRYVSIQAPENGVKVVPVARGSESLGGSRAIYKQRASVKLWNKYEM